MSSVRSTHYGAIFLEDGGERKELFHVNLIDQVQSFTVNQQNEGHN